MMAAKKIIVVIGATGNQGSSVAKTFLEYPGWHVRALTRNPSSESAQSLEKKGAEIVQGDLLDRSSLASAFKDANAIFLNTDFWEVYRPLKAELDRKGEDDTMAGKQAFDAETTKGKNAAVVAAAVPTLERFIYSALPSPRKASGGKYSRSSHPESKAFIVDFIEEELPDLARKTSFIYIGAYISNALLTPRLDQASGKYVFSIPLNHDTKFPIIDQRNSTGPFVHALITVEQPGVKLLAYDSIPSMEQIAEIWSKASGKEAIFVTTSSQVMHDKMGLSWELLDAFDAMREFGLLDSLPGIIEPHQLKSRVETKTFEQLLKDNNLV